MAIEDRLKSVLQSPPLQTNGL